MIIGCYRDSKDARLLPGSFGKYTSTNHTLNKDICIKRCGLQGYSLAGFQFGHECHCGEISFNDLDLKNGNAVTTQIIFMCRITLRFDQHNIRELSLCDDQFLLLGGWKFVLLCSHYIICVLAFILLPYKEDKQLFAK